VKDNHIDPICLLERTVLTLINNIDETVNKKRIYGCLEMLLSLKLTEQRIFNTLTAGCSHFSFYRYELVNFNYRQKTGIR
jgi:hypothetical protein